jgi:hypothetical protein
VPDLSLDAIGKLAKGLDVEIADLFRLSSKKSPDPTLIEILTLLEGQSPKLRRQALRLIEVLVEG